MGFLPVKAFAFVQLSLLLLRCSSGNNVYGEGVNTVIKAPPPPPPHQLSRPVHLTPPPPPPPHKPPVGVPLYVQGFVYCRPCKQIGSDALARATPLPGAVVKLECNNTKQPFVQQVKAGKWGNFWFPVSTKFSTNGVHKCKVHLVSSPVASCSKPTDIHGGIRGALPVPLQPNPDDKKFLTIYEAGPFAFEPVDLPKCPR